MVDEGSLSSICICSVGRFLNVILSNWRPLNIHSMIANEVNFVKKRPEEN